MKTTKFTILSIFLLIISSANLMAQVVYDSVSIQAGYSNMSFYSLHNGEQANVSNTDWDIAFDVSGFGATIRLNAQNGNALYAYPNGDHSSWATVDTTGISGWAQLNDSDTAWWLGAFNQNASSNPSDMGWGNYNTSTHHITGDSLFIITLDNGDIKKLDIQKLASGIYSFRYADINGNNLVLDSIDKTAYTGKNFVYYSLQTNQEIDKEPLSADWDIVFEKYTGLLAPNVYYGVTGVLQNIDVTIAKATPIANPKTESNYSALTFNTEINTIGYDWKSYNMQAASYDIQDSLAFFIQDKGNSIWRLVLTGFEGSSTGKIKFEKELLAFPTATSNLIAEPTLAIYPNPVARNLHIVLDVQNGDTWEAKLYTLNGQMLKSDILNSQGFTDYQMDVSSIAGGTYFIELLNTKTAYKKTEKLIINN